MTPNLQNWVGPTEAARIAGLSAHHINRLADAGKIPHQRTALGRLYDPEQVQRWAEERAAR